MRDFRNFVVVGLKPSGIRKFFDIANTMEGVISLGVGEPDFDTPWDIRQKAIQSIQDGKTFYTSNSGLFELREAVSHYLRSRFNLSYDPKKEVLLTVGCSEAIDLAFRAIIEPGDEVIVPTPCYVSYLPCAALAGAKVIEVPLKSENNFMMTGEDLEKTITPKTKAIVMNYPNNPTGAVMDLAHLNQVADIAKKHDLLIVSDEVYSELIYGVKHISIASLPGMKERTILINGFSKSFSMTGWRVGYACGPEKILEQMTKIHQFAIMCVSTASQFAALEALNDCQESVFKMRDEYDKRRKYLMATFDEMGLKYIVPHGAFYLFVDIRNFQMSSEEFALSLLNEEKVVVVPGNAFGDAGEGYVRISYAYSISDLEKACARIHHWISKHQRDIY